jgi:prepilin-type processing-associated H-X9-DG protein
VELLVVVSIIALLIGILLPSLRSARTQAKRVACASNLRQLGIAHTTYALDNQGVLVPNGLSADGSWPLWYLSADEGGVFARYWAGRESSGEKLLACPSDKTPYPLEKDPGLAHASQTSFALNAWVKGTGSGSNRTYERWGAGGNAIERMRQPSGTMLMAETWRWHSIMDREAVGTGTWDAHYGPKPDQPDRYPGNLEWDDRERHDANLNFLFVDTHVSWRHREQGVPKAAEDRHFWGPGYN